MAKHILKQYLTNKETPSYCLQKRQESLWLFFLNLLYLDVHFSWYNANFFSISLHPSLIVNFPFFIIPDPTSVFIFHFLWSISNLNFWISIFFCSYLTISTFPLKWNTKKSKTKQLFEHSYQICTKKESRKMCS